MVTLLSIVYSDASDIGFDGYNESCQSIVYSDACDIGFGGQKNLLVPFTLHVQVHTTKRGL